jgi:hypothetical protein
MRNTFSVNELIKKLEENVFEGFKELSMAWAHGPGGI